VPLEDGYIGTAYAEFGPVTIEPSQKQSLDYILGSGGTWFPVTIYFKADRDKQIDKRRSQEGNLIVETDWLILQGKNSFTSDKEVLFDLKYTISCPQVHATLLDTQML